jgi:tetratricopeptide (TPR) repeat protein
MNEQASRVHRLAARLIGVALVVLLAVACAMLTLKLQQERQANERLARASELVHRGGGLAQRGRYEDALNELEAAIQLDPRSAEAHTRAAECYAMLGKYDETVAHYRHALEIKASASIHLQLGTYYIYASKEFDSARREIREALRLEPDSSKAYAAMGDLEKQVIQENGGADYQTAKSYYTKATQKDPRRPEGYVGLGYVQLDEGDADAAIESFRQATEQVSDEGLASSHLALGEAFLWKGDLDQALQQCSLAVGLLGTEAPGLRAWIEERARSRLSDIYYLRGRYELAKIETNQAIEIDNRMNYKADEGQQAQSLATIALRQRNMEMAEKLLDQALKSDPNNNNTFFVRGIVFKSRGQPDKARADWEMALEMCKGTDPLERMQRIGYSIALEKPGSLEAERQIIKEKCPPLGMLIAAFDDVDLLTSFNVNPVDSTAVRQLLEDAIRARHGQDLLQRREE